MRFCPKCGSLLRPKKEGKVLMLVCARDGTKVKAKDASEGTAFTEAVKAPDEVIVIDVEKNPFPKTEWRCGKCGAKEAYFWSMQLRRSDEAETTFYRCVGCGKTWRRSG